MQLQKNDLQRAQAAQKTAKTVKVRLLLKILAGMTRFYLVTGLQHVLFVVFLFPAPSVQQRSQIEELRKFGKEFRVRAQPSLFGDVQIPDQS